MAAYTGHAFPTSDSDSTGMDLRNYFAAQALVGIMANPAYQGMDLDNGLASLAHSMAARLSCKMLVASGNGKLQAGLL